MTSFIFREINLVSEINRRLYEGIVHIKVINNNGNEWIDLDIFCKQNNVKFIGVVPSPALLCQMGLFEDLNHHSSKLNKELNDLKNTR